MAMAKFIVDGPNLLLIAKPGVVSVDVQTDLYSDAKEHWLATADNKYNFPLRTVGGDPIGGGKFAGDLYFLQNGWKIRPQEANHELLLDGNLFLDAAEVGGIFVPTLGGYTVLTTVQRSADVRGILTGATPPDWTATEREQIRQRLGIDGVTSSPGATPSLATAVAVASVPSSVWGTTLPGAFAAGTAAWLVDYIRKLSDNRLEVNFATQRLVLYADDGITVVQQWALGTLGGEPVATVPGVQTKRGAPIL